VEASEDYSLVVTGHVHKEVVHLLSLQSASITSSDAFKPERNDLSQFEKTQADPLCHCLSENLIS